MSGEHAPNVSYVEQCVGCGADVVIKRERAVEPLCPECQGRQRRARATAGHAEAEAAEADRAALRARQAAASEACEHCRGFGCRFCDPRLAELASGEQEPNVSAWQKAMRGPGKPKKKLTILSVEEIRPETFEVAFDTGAEGVHRARLYPQGGHLESGTYRFRTLTGEETPEGAKIWKAIADYKRTREHTPNEDQGWRDTYARGYREAEGRGLQPWQAREEASRAAWRDYEARTGRPAHIRNGGLWTTEENAEYQALLTEYDRLMAAAEDAEAGGYAAEAATLRRRAVRAEQKADRMVRSHEANGAMPPGFESFDASGVFGDEVMPGTGGASRAAFRDVKRGDVLRVGAQRYEVLQVWDSFNAMVQKPGAKRKAFALMQNRLPEGAEVIEVREQRGTPETTLAGPVLAVVPLAQVERVGAVQRANGSGYYVWVLARGSNAPLAEGPYGPYDTLESAKTFARIGATEGAHDRAVSLGIDPKAPSFQIVRRYEAGTGERLL